MLTTCHKQSFTIRMSYGVADALIVDMRLVIVHPDTQL